MPNRKINPLVSKAYSELLDIIRDDWNYEGTLKELQKPNLTWKDINAEPIDIPEIIGQVCDSLHITTPATTYKITDKILDTLNSLSRESKAA